jgi:NAD(P)-dependent dehydrogenase (short-subunit alcohol dehydrogenase family)
MVNAVAPGWTLTDSKIVSGIDLEIASNAMRTMSMKKLASPEDIAGAVAFLLSDVTSGHISGQVIEVSGGMEGRVIPGPGE